MDGYYYTQLFYNFTHGKMFQSSVYWMGGPGVIHNPFSYIHSFSYHVNFTPYLFAYLYSIHPTITFHYLIVIGFNCIFFPYFGWKILKQLTQENVQQKYFLALSLFLSSSVFLITIVYQCHPVLFSGPFILAMYYFLIKKKEWAFYITSILTALIAEDLAIFTCTFAIYIFFFEKNLRRYSYFPFIFSFVYVLVVLFIIQPLSKQYLVVANTSESGARLMKILSGVSVKDVIIPHLKVLILPLALFTCCSFLIIHFTQTQKEKIQWFKLLGLVFLAPSGYWFISIFETGVQHHMPIFTTVFIALIIVLSKYQVLPTISLRRFYCVSVVVSILFLGNIAYSKSVYVHLLPTSLLSHIEHLFPSKLKQQYERIKKENLEKERNNYLVQVVDTIPKTSSMVIWTNCDVVSFCVNRSDIWVFPKNYTISDYLVIQKNAKRSFVELSSVKDDNVSNLPDREIYDFPDIEKEYIIDMTSVNYIHDKLVNKEKTHMVILDDKYILLLKRKMHYDIPIPHSSIGFNFFRKHR